MAERVWMTHPDLPGQRIQSHPGGVAVRQASGWVLDETAGAPGGPSTPPYVHRLLDAYLSGQPLDFDGTSVPADVRARLEQAHQAEVVDTDRPTRPARRAKNAPEEQE